MHEKCTKDFRRYCLVGNDAEDCRLGMFQESFLCRRFAAFEVDVWRHGLRIGLSHYGNNEVDVQESSRRLRSGSESEIILPGACSRKDGSPCSILWESAGRKPFLVNPSRETLNIRDADHMTVRLSTSTNWIPNPLVMSQQTLHTPHHRSNSSVQTALLPSTWSSKVEASM